jgi:hypothetical protein
MTETTTERITEAVESVTPRHVVAAGMILFASGLGWGTVEFWRHGQIHAVSALFVGAMIFLGLSLFAGMERVSAALRAIASAIRDARGSR